MHQVVVPDLGEGIVKAKVACWHCRPGDTVKEGQEVAEVATDKAIFNVEADKAGTVRRILAREGDEVAIGEAILVIE